MNMNIDWKDLRKKNVATSIKPYNFEVNYLFYSWNIFMLLNNLIWLRFVRVLIWENILIVLPWTTKIGSYVEAGLD